MNAHYPRLATLRGVGALRARLAELGLQFPCDDESLAAPHSPLAQPLDLGGGLQAPNRFAIQPMEGWDAERDGRPSALTERRWQRFGASGAGWIWGGEAVAVCREGRSNPGQLWLTDESASSIGGLRRRLLESAAREGHPAPVVGLQLTHSGRWARPDGAAAPRTAFEHPLLDVRVGAGRSSVVRDAEFAALAGAFARAARLAQSEGFEFVDLKHCHGYLLHELLAARARDGDYGGAALEARTRFLVELIAAVRAAAPGLEIGVRLSVFDRLPHRPGADRTGMPEPAALPYESGFGVDAADPARSDFVEPIALARLLVRLGVRLLNVTAGSPYYVPHVQRPALFPPSDGYLPPEDPLAGVARLLDAARVLKQSVPGLIVLSSGWTYLQEFIAPVAQACVREGWCDAIGLGRMALSLPGLPADVLAGRRPERALVCRTFSDCTSAPRNGFVSGCYPLDRFYRERPEQRLLAERKREAAGTKKESTG